MSLRYSTPWMEQVDERILEYLYDESMATPTVLTEAVQYSISRRRVRERCEVLTDAGLIAPIVEGSRFYEITDLGIMYLKGRLVTEGLLCHG